VPLLDVIRRYIHSTSKDLARSVDAVAPKLFPGIQGPVNSLYAEQKKAIAAPAIDAPESISYYRSGRAWVLVGPLDFKSSTASDEGAGWVRFPHPPADLARDAYRFHCPS